jgi:hypothetical protein
MRDMLIRNLVSWNSLTLNFYQCPSVFISGLIFSIQIPLAV